MVLSHLVVTNSLSKPFYESHNFSRIASFIDEPSRFAFFQQLLQSLLDLFQCAATTVNREWDDG